MLTNIVKIWENTVVSEKVETYMLTPPLSCKSNFEKIENPGAKTKLRRPEKQGLLKECELTPRGGNPPARFRFRRDAEVQIWRDAEFRFCV